MSNALYNSIRDDGFAVVCNEYTIVARCYSIREAKAEAKRRNMLAQAGLLPAGVYDVQSLTLRPEARPFKLHVSGTGF